MNSTENAAENAIETMTDEAAPAVSLSLAAPAETADPGDAGDTVAARAAGECACPQGERASSGPSRRTVLSGAGALGSVGMLAGIVGPASATQLAFAAPGYTGDTVVVLSLRGGFDGLSAVVPSGDPDYLKARPSIGVPAARTLKLDAMFGLHPALAPLKRVWDAKGLAAVHAVGQVNPTRSHFEAMASMENAAPGSSVRTGWLDRMVGTIGAPTTFSAATVGATVAPQSLMGPNPKIALRSIDTFALSGASTSVELARWQTALRALHVGAPAAMTATANVTLNALAQTAALKGAGYVPAAGAVYPVSEVGNALRDVARLIKAGVGLRAATVDVGNWDMHTGLGASDSGWMFRQLTDLAQALAAFYTDLGGMPNVTLVTMSEFGRRVAENASGGVDHGHGNVCLLMGGGVIGGRVYGRWPGLSAANLVAGDLAGTTDYRTVLAEVLEKRAKLSTAAVFPGLGSARLGALRVRA